MTGSSATPPRSPARRSPTREPASGWLGTVLGRLTPGKLARMLFSTPTPPPPPPKATPARRAPPPPPPPPKTRPPPPPPLAARAKAREAKRREDALAGASSQKLPELEEGQLDELPPPKPPPPKPPKPPPPKPPKPPPPRPPKPPAGAPKSASKKRVRASAKERAMSTKAAESKAKVQKPESSDEEEELEDGEVPKLVNLYDSNDAMLVDDDDAKTPEGKLEKIEKIAAKSREVLGGGEFDTMENIARLRDDADETLLNNVNSPQYKKRKPKRRRKASTNASTEDGSLGRSTGSSIDKAKKMHPSLERLIASRKLALVLDLDHTLLNSVLVPDLRTDSNWLSNAMRLLDADVKRAEDANDPLKRSVFHLQHFDLLTKLRPGVRRFLERASRLFEIHINTMGSQAYADQMVELLDPEKRWIHGTVRGLGEMEGGKLWAPAEKTLDGALEHLADVCLIFDDTASVWESHRRNLVTCERYLFFPQARRQFGLSGMSLLEIGQDESEEEGMLSTAMKVFESVHSAYFAGGYEKNVKHKVRAPKQHASDVRAVQEILCAQRKKVLADVRIVFSRVFPIDADPTTHPLWILAEDFGATCGRTLADDTTHVVGTASSTDKVKAAKARGNVHAVTPHWLECSMLLWRRANEAKFRI